MVNEKLIKDMYNVEDDFTIKCKYDSWYKEILNKNPSHLTVKDIQTMLNQNIFLELAIKMACIQINHDFLSGELYGGQLLEVICNLSSVQINNYYTELEELVSFIKKQIETYDFEDDFEKNEYQKIFVKFKKKLSVD